MTFDDDTLKDFGLKAGDGAGTPHQYSLNDFSNARWWAFAVRLRIQESEGPLSGAGSLTRRVLLIRALKGHSPTVYVADDTVELTFNLDGDHVTALYKGLALTWSSLDEAGVTEVEPLSVQMVGHDDFDEALDNGEPIEYQSVTGSVVELEQARRSIMSLVDLSVLDPDIRIDEKEFVQFLRDIGYDLGSRSSRNTEKEVGETSHKRSYEVQPRTDWIEDLGALANEHRRTNGDRRSLEEFASKVMQLIIRGPLDHGEALLSQAGVGRELGVSRQRAHQLLADAGAPRPLLIIEGNKQLWLKEEVLDWRSLPPDKR